MGIENVAVIDAIGTDKITGDIILTIADPLDWNESTEHLRALQAKIHRYLDFVESGQIYDEYPSSKGKKIKINVVFRVPPTEEAAIFFAKTRPHCGKLGVELTHKTMTDSEP